MKWKFTSNYDNISDKGVKNEVTRIKWISTNDDNGEIIMTSWWPNNNHTNINPNTSIKINQP